jgi:hypothetical protein
MKKITPYLLYFIVGAGIAADHWYGITESGNVAIAAIWSLVILTLIGVFTDTEKGKSTRSKTGRLIIHSLAFGNIVLLFAVGWFVTGASLLIAKVAFWIKQQNMSTEKGNSEESGD